MPAESMAGKLRHWITIASRSTGQGSGGSQLRNWTTVLQCWARIEPLSGRELIAAQAVQNVATHRITMRYTDTAINAGMRVQYGSRNFNIVSPPRNADERNRTFVFEAQEGLKNG